MRLAPALLILASLISGHEVEPVKTSVDIEKPSTKLLPFKPREEAQYLLYEGRWPSVNGDPFYKSYIVVTDANGEKRLVSPASPEGKAIMGAKNTLATIYPNDNGFDRLRNLHQKPKATTTEESKPRGSSSLPEPIAADITGSTLGN